MSLANLLNKLLLAVAMMSVFCGLASSSTKSDQSNRPGSPRTPNPIVQFNSSLQSILRPQSRSSAPATAPARPTTSVAPPSRSEQRPATPTPIHAFKNTIAQVLRPTNVQASRPSVSAQPPRLQIPERTSAPPRVPPDGTLASSGSKGSGTASNQDSKAFQRGPNPSKEPSRPARTEIQHQTQGTDQGRGPLAVKVGHASGSGSNPQAPPSQNLPSVSKPERPKRDGHAMQQATASRPARSVITSEHLDRRSPARDRSSTVVTVDNRHQRSHSHPRYVFVHRDRHDRPRYQVVWPTFRVAIRYRRDADWCIGFVYPFYLRKYVFVSLDGWWPWDCTVTRYYWYGCHPYWWYGPCPVAKEVTYNYYTYNYSDQPDQSRTKTIYGIPEDRLRPTPPQTEEKPPNTPSEADYLFETGVTAFEQGQFDQAAEAFLKAMDADPQDRIIPFAYAQSLFAEGKYSQAAEVLRNALAAGPDEKGILYPRGLYKDDQVLYDQIDQLAGAVKTSPQDMDLQLLLGYQLLGIGQAQQAIGPLEIAVSDPINGQAAGRLLELARSIDQAMADQPQQIGGVTSQAQ